jgi:hypothetical protein
MEYQISAGALPTGSNARSEEAILRLREAAERLNERYTEDLAISLQQFGQKVILTGVITSGQAVPWLILDFLLETWPQPFGVSIDCQITRASGVLQPGSKLATLRNRKERIFIRGENGEEIFRATTILWEAILGGWSARQVRTLRLMRELGRQKQVAEAMGVTPQSISETLGRAHWPRLKKSLNIMGELLS